MIHLFIYSCDAIDKKSLFMLAIDQGEEQLT